MSLFPVFPAKRQTFRISVTAAGLLASGVALADAHLAPQLVQKMTAAGAGDDLQVVVSYEHDRRSVVSGKRVSVRVHLGGSSLIYKIKTIHPFAISSSYCFITILLS